MKWSQGTFTNYKKIYIYCTIDKMKHRVIFIPEVNSIKRITLGIIFILLYIYYLHICVYNVYV